MIKKEAKKQRSKETEKQMSLGRMSLIIGVITIGSNYLFASILNRSNNQRYIALYNELNDLKRQLKKEGVTRR